MKWVDSLEKNKPQLLDALWILEKNLLLENNLFLVLQKEFKFFGTITFNKFLQVLINFSKDCLFHKFEANYFGVLLSFLLFWYADAPCLILAHEFLDCLPVHHFYFDKEKGWIECLVDIDPFLSSPYNFRFILSPGPTVASLTYVSRFLSGKTVEDGTIYEFCPELVSFTEEITNRLSSVGGACLIFDYGEEKEIFPPSLRVKKKKKQKQ